MKEDHLLVGRAKSRMRLLIVTVEVLGSILGAAAAAAFLQTGEINLKISTVQKIVC